VKINGQIQGLFSKKLPSIRRKAAKVVAVSELVREGRMGRFGEMKLLGKRILHPFPFS
jgi:hypothetical protein